MHILTHARRALAQKFAKRRSTLAQELVSALLCAGEGLLGEFLLPLLAEEFGGAVADGGIGRQMLHVVVAQELHLSRQRRIALVLVFRRIFLQEPEAHGFWLGSETVLRAPMKRFPYAVLYEIRPDKVRILSVRHDKRHPCYGMGR
jgi:hypothetical protein